jgi:predicted aconitase
VALYHVENVTPEYKDASKHIADLDKIVITQDDIKETRKTYPFPVKPQI